MTDQCSFWGNAGHLQYVSEALRQKYSEDELHIRLPKANTGNNTYDGIETGAERVTQEIENYLEEFRQQGVTIRKFSAVGYSLGGLVARYAIGLLDSRGWFEKGKLEPVNFTTFASPHLGVRSPYEGARYRFYNAIGSNTLSVSGQQLFLNDKFRDTGRPLLAVLADPQAIFMKALAKFKNRILYCNITNDRSAPYYTTGISLTDPFSDLDALTLKYMPGHAPNLLDATRPASIKPMEEELPSLFTRLSDRTSSFISSAPQVGLITILTPIALTVFLVNAGIQSVRSQQRIKLHEGANFRIPLLAEKVRSTMEGAFEELQPRPRTQRSLTGSSMTRPHLNVPQADDPSSSASSSSATSTTTNPSSAPSPSPSEAYFQGTLLQTSTILPSDPDLPCTQSLSLHPEQISMISNLDAVGFRKFRVHITQVRYSHAAIIVRSPTRKGLQEGKVVVGHWVDSQFEL